MIASVYYHRSAYAHRERRAALAHGSVSNMIMVGMGTESSEHFEISSFKFEASNLGAWCLGFEIEHFENLEFQI